MYAGVAKIQEVSQNQDIEIGEVTTLEMNQSTCETSMVDEQSGRYESEAIELGEISQEIGRAHV